MVHAFKHFFPYLILVSFLSLNGHAKEETYQEKRQREALEEIKNPKTKACVRQVLNSNVHEFHPKPISEKCALYLYKGSAELEWDSFYQANGVAQARLSIAKRVEEIQFNYFKRTLLKRYPKTKRSLMDKVLRAERAAWKDYIYAFLREKDSFEYLAGTISGVVACYFLEDMHKARIQFYRMYLQKDVADAIYYVPLAQSKFDYFDDGLENLEAFHLEGGKNLKPHDTLYYDYDQNCLRERCLSPMEIIQRNKQSFEDFWQRFYPTLGFQTRYKKMKENRNALINYELQKVFTFFKAMRFDYMFPPSGFDESLMQEGQAAFAKHILATERMLDYVLWEDQQAFKAAHIYLLYQSRYMYLRDLQLYHANEGGLKPIPHNATDFSGLRRVVVGSEKMPLCK